MYVLLHVPTLKFKNICFLFLNSGGVYIRLECSNFFFRHAQASPANRFYQTNRKDPVQINDSVIHLRHIILILISVHYVTIIQLIKYSHLKPTEFALWTKVKINSDSVRTVSESFQNKSRIMFRLWMNDSFTKLYLSECCCSSWLVKHTCLFPPRTVYRQFVRGKKCLYTFIP